ncbi:hypothetical protein CFC21_001305 [Triticum aestivum]|uniref:Uncharacterized protein n=3 Tax=Triticum TaxID=4564 RepID=A0A9R0Q4H0_TRITD|nr:hypothetical protein TRIUR3_26402 [Triticum urartu]KAF6983000.1 hypothetical protein CFC21_001305 [Triticum aestivum]VAH03163.1 unnamed protein product [Triticum turgidum subsp. durum]
MDEQSMCSACAIRCEWWRLHVMEAVSGGGCTSWRQSVTPCSRSLQRRRSQTGTLLMSTTLHRFARPQLPLSRAVTSIVDLTSTGDVHDHDTDEK